jgi:ERCC3/RAD25/XPB C-terminal helicase
MHCHTDADNTHSLLYASCLLLLPLQQQYHQQRGDKIIIFADNVFALKRYSQVLRYSNNTNQ